MKIRTIITQDAEVDDQNSLRHFLLYSNEVELQGIVQTSSKFHWKGAPGTKAKPVTLPGEFLPEDAGSQDYTRPYRWPGTEWMFRVIDDYEADYPNLCRQAEGYPEPDYLRSITKVGNIGCKGEMEGPTEGSELIRRAILDGDPRTLYLQVWGGCNTIARALNDIQHEYEDTPGWQALREKIMHKVVITACGEQDENYRTVIAENWPDILFVKTLQMMSYAYGWFTMPEGESKDTLKAPFMRRALHTSGSALASGYCTWMDGHAYEGEDAPAQFGVNPNIARDWFGARFIKAQPEQYDFLSEGDSPTFFCLLPWGFRGPDAFCLGGMGGRYEKVIGEFNSKGEPLNIWDVAKDAYTGRDGKTILTESMWPYVADIQRDFAARLGWAGGTCSEHAPQLTVDAPDMTAAPGETVTVHAEAVDAGITFRVYPELSADWAKGIVILQDGKVTIPTVASAGDQLHIIVKAQSGGVHRLVRYCHVIITIQ